MSKKEISDGVAHKMPPDLKKALISTRGAPEVWEDITPLARNEWICWIENSKKSETRNHRITRTYTELLQGKRRPCCWVGCTHR